MNDNERRHTTEAPRVCYFKNHLPEYMGEGIPVSFSSNSNLTPPVLVVRTPHPPLRHSDIGTTPYTYPSRIGTPIPENIEENMQSNCQLHLTTSPSTQKKIGTALYTYPGKIGTLIPKNIK